MNEDIFGVIRHADNCQDEIVILKSKAMAHLIEVDGMDYDEANEYYEYNIAGALGDRSYSCVDDTLLPDIIEEIIDEGEIINPPYTGRKDFKQNPIIKDSSGCLPDENNISSNL